MAKKTRAKAIKAIKKSVRKAVRKGVTEVQVEQAVDQAETTELRKGKSTISNSADDDPDDIGS
jgi:hypothetical protein